MARPRVTLGGLAGCGHLKFFRLGSCSLLRGFGDCGPGFGDVRTGQPHVMTLLRGCGPFGARQSGVEGGRVLRFVEFEKDGKRETGLGRRRVSSSVSKHQTKLGTMGISRHVVWGPGRHVRSDAGNPAWGGPWTGWYGAVRDALGARETASGPGAPRFWGRPGESQRAQPHRGAKPAVCVCVVRMSNQPYAPQSGDARPARPGRPGHVLTVR